MSKPTKIHLIQGKKTFNGIQSVDVAKDYKSVASDKWQVELDMNDNQELYEAWQLNPSFELHIEYSSQDNGKLLRETITGEMIITCIEINGVPKNRYKAIGYMNTFNLSQKGQVIREKVQFT